MGSAKRFEIQEKEGAEMIDTDGLCDKCECGALADLSIKEGRLWAVKCSDRCGESTAFYKTQMEAITAWNQERRKVRK